MWPPGRAERAPLPCQQPLQCERHTGSFCFSFLVELELIRCIRKSLLPLGSAELFEQVVKSLQPRVGHVPELSFVQIPHRLVQRLQELPSPPRNARLHHAAVVLLPLAGDPTLLFQAVQKPGNVRIVGDHTVANGAAGETFRSGSSQDPQDVVLRAGQLRGVRQLLRLPPQGVGGLQQGEKDALLKRAGRVRRLGLGIHDADNSRANDYCQEEMLDLPMDSRACAACAIEVRSKRFPAFASQSLPPRVLRRPGSTLCQDFSARCPKTQLPRFPGRPRSRGCRAPASLPSCSLTGPSGPIWKRSKSHPRQKCFSPPGS